MLLVEEKEVSWFSTGLFWVFAASLGLGCDFIQSMCTTEVMAFFSEEPDVCLATGTIRIINNSPSCPGITPSTKIVLDQRLFWCISYFRYSLDSFLSKSTFIYTWSMLCSSVGTQDRYSLIPPVYLVSLMESAGERGSIGGGSLACQVTDEDEIRSVSSVILKYRWASGYIRLQWR